MSRFQLHQVRFEVLAAGAKAIFFGLGGGFVGFFGERIQILGRERFLGGFGDAFEELFRRFDLPLGLVIHRIGDGGGSLILGELVQFLLVLGNVVCSAFLGPGDQIVFDGHFIRRRLCFGGFPFIVAGIDAERVVTVTLAILRADAIFLLLFSRLGCFLDRIDLFFFILAALFLELLLGFDLVMLNVLQLVAGLGVFFGTWL